MFSFKFGKVNNIGFSKIVEDLNTLVTEIDQYVLGHEPQIHDEADFFRP
jgi:hypothetical protein